MLEESIKGRFELRLEKLEALLLVHSIIPIGTNQVLVVEEREDVLAAGDVTFWHFFMT